MAKAKKLPSGNYRVLLYEGMKDGKRQYASFTAETADEAEYQALEYKLGKKRKRNKICFDFRKRNDLLYR